MPKLLIFQTILPGCEEGNPEAWRAFLRDYTSTATSLLGVYSPWTPNICLDHWRAALRSLSADNYAALGKFSHQSEREFLVDLRAFLQDFALTKLNSSDDALNPPAPSIETLGELFKGLPLAHQELVFLALGGYSQATLEKILRITPSVAKEGLARLQAKYGSLLERTEDRCPWPTAWIGIGKIARSTEKQDCTPLRQLVRILDGQASWYEKSPAETHRESCLHCLELWTSLKEVSAWDRARQPLPEETIDALFAALPCKTERKKQSIIGRILGK